MAAQGEKVLNDRNYSYFCKLMPINVAVVTAVTPTIYQGHFWLTSLLAIWLTKHTLIKDKKC